LACGNGDSITEMIDYDSKGIKRYRLNSDLEKVALTNIALDEE
jgi:hypothetical protein